MTSILSRFASTIICLVLISLSVSAHAIDETYELYSGNGNYYLKAEPTWVPISGSVFIIIPLYEDGKILKLAESNGNWSVQNLTFSQFNAANPSEVTDGSISYSDLNSDGSIDIALNLGSSSGNQLLEIINDTSTGSFSANVPNNGWNAKGGMVADAALPVMSVPESSYYGPLKGRAGVSGGSATYSIPIEVPPGRNNMQPSVSIQYSNRSGNGIAGVGWSMSAESKIHRCSATEAQDGYKAAVQFDATLDRLCLDGQRLISIGVEDYGTNGAVYKTEMESLVIVTQSGGINSATSSFVAQLPDGRSQSFGTTDDSRHSPDGVNEILNWALAKTVDLSGNNIIYSYSDHSTSEYLLDSILYTGLGMAAGNRKVLFSYENKATFSTSYIAGGKMRTTKQLATVTTALGDETIRQYTLTYAKSLNSGRNLLRSISACGFEDNTQIDCFESTTFQWQETAPQYAFEKLGYQDGSEFVTPFSDARYLKDVIPSGDIDGNGVRDYAGFSMDAEGNFIETNTKQLTHCYFAANSFSITCPIADFNNDGKSDSFRQSGGLLQIKYTDSGSWFDTDIIWENNNRHLNMPLTFSDFNGDGRVDVAFKHHQTSVGNSKLYVYMHTGNDSNPYSTAIGNRVLVHDFAVPTHNGGIYRDTRDVQVSGDMDGNGLLDFVLFDNNAYSSLIAPGMPIPDKIFLTKVNSAGAISIDKTSRDFSGHVLSNNYNGNFLHDVNGDGLVDWLSFSQHSSALLYRLNNGADFDLQWKSLGVSIPVKQVEYQIEPGEWEYYIAPVMSKVMFFDYDGDGKDDFLIAGDILASSCAYTGIKQIYKWYCDDELYTSYTFDRGGVQNFFGPAIASGRFDDSAREFNFVKITENAAGDLVSAAPVSTDIIASATQQAALDATGDGLVDIVTVFGCRFASSVCEWNEDIQTSTYPGATTTMDIEPGGYINRNLGAATGNEFYAAYDVMKSVDNGVGLKSTWTYHPLTTGAVDDFYSMNFNDAVDSEHFHFASSMFAVSKFEQDSGVGTTKNTIDYQYNGAMYNTQGRGFRGFRKIIETHLLTQISTETTFGQKFPQSGLVERRETYALNRSTTAPFKIETNDWQDNLAHNVSGVYLLHNEQSETTTYDITDLATLISKETRTISQANLSDLHVDAWGNSLKSVNVTTDNVYGVNTVTSTNIFDATDAWPNKLTCSSIEKSYVPSASVTSIHADIDLNKTTTTKIDTWDATIRKPLSVSTRAGAPAADCDITGLGVGTTTVTNYNSFGLPEQVDVNGEVLAGSGDTPTMQTRTTELEYTTDGYFVDKVTLNQSHVQEIVTDSRSGLPLQTTDANGIIVSSTYDSLFRPISIENEGVPIQEIVYQTPDSDTPNSDAVAMVSVYQAGQPESHEYKDKLGRTLRTKTQGFDGNDIYTDMRYDSLGRMTKQSNPHSGTAVYTLYNNYDELGRVGQKVTTSTDVNETLKTEYIYDGLKTKINTIATDGYDLSMSRTYNALGHLMETVDAKSGTTEYAYDAAGNPVVVKDAAGNIAYTRTTMIWAASCGLMIRTKVIL